MITIIAEKPSVAHEIAIIVGATEKSNGYFTGNGYSVTWAFGHLVGLSMPEDYGFKGFDRANLPMLPHKFILKVKQIREGKIFKDDLGVVKQLKIIDKLFTDSESIIVATDAGREGELIFRYIYNYLKCTKPFQRLWISSLTDKAIRIGLENLKDGSCFDNLYVAAKARSEADWLVGINASQALSIAANAGIFSLGRVQTPTLSMICSRFIENKLFISTPFWQISFDTGKDNIEFKAIIDDKYTSIETATSAKQAISDIGSVLISSIDKKEVIQSPPLLYDLTTLQKEANRKYGFSADKTLSIAQALYERKYITYPRTGSRYISNDVFETIGERISFLEGYDIFRESALKMREIKLNSNCVNDKKVTDHHALLITENIPINLSHDDKNIYDLVAGRMLEGFSDACVKDTTTSRLLVGKYCSTIKGSIIKSMGWRGVYTELTEENLNEGILLPNLIEGETLSIKNIELIEKKTRPLPLHTESSLLSAMENCGKEIKDEEINSIIKVCGIGTPATRAATIETLISRDYVVRNKKTLVPTDKGISVYDVVKDKRIANVEMTGRWETTLFDIENGEKNVEGFSTDIKNYVTELVEELLSVKDIKDTRKALICPKCKEKFIILPKVGKCFNTNCNFTIFRIIAKKTLTDNQIETLIKNKRTSLIKGFTSKTDTKFDAILILNKDYQLNFEFAKKYK